MPETGVLRGPVPSSTASGAGGAAVGAALWAAPATGLDGASGRGGVACGFASELKSSCLQWSQGLLLASAAVAAGALARSSARRRSAAGKSCRGAVACRGFRDGSETRQLMEGQESPSDLYELLGIHHDAEKSEIKKAYHDLQKICHPDVAGADGEEMCVLLNDAYSLLNDDSARSQYNEQLEVVKKDPTKKPVSTDLGPTWKWTSKRPKMKPVFDGTPKSRSVWAKVKPDDQGHKYTEQRFVYVDEFKCISCRNCCDIAPKTFCIDIEYGRARVYTQWGDSEEYLDYAVQSCPVDCIEWVSRKELQTLEHVTQDTMYEANGQLPCPMAARADGNMKGEPLPDAWALAQKFEEKRARAQSQQSELMIRLNMDWVDKVKERIAKVLGGSSEALRKAVLQIKQRL